MDNKANEKQFLNINLNTLSFLIASFNDVINNFGSNSKSIQFYRTQITNLLDIGQISSDEYDIINFLINFSYVNDKKKWQLELEKVNYFTHIMDIIISNSTDKKTVNAILMSIETSNLTTGQKRAITLIKRIFGIKETTSTDIKMKGTSNFGTNNYKNNNTENKNKKTWMQKSKSMHELRLKAYTLMTSVITDRENTVIRIKNLDAACSNDPSNHYFNVCKLLVPDNNKEDRNSNEYYFKLVLDLHKRGARQHVGIREYNYDRDACRGSYTWKNNDEATEIMEQFLNEAANANFEQ